MVISIFFSNENTEAQREGTFIYIIEFGAGTSTLVMVRMMVKIY